MTFRPLKNFLKKRLEEYGFCKEGFQKERKSEKGKSKKFKTE